MIELQRIGMTLPSSPRDLESKEVDRASGEVKGHTDSASSGVRGAPMKVTVPVGNKFELLMGHDSDDGN